MNSTSLLLRAELARLVRICSILGAGAFVGCHIDVDDDGRRADCDDWYTECYDEADSTDDVRACEAGYDACIEPCADEGRGPVDSSHGAGEHGEDDAGRVPPGDTESETDTDGDTDTETDGEEDSSSTGDAGPDPACFDIHATCIGAAATLAEAEACEALFDQCVGAEHCDGDDACPDACPDPAVTACLDDYATCSATAVDEASLGVCMAQFDGCAEGLDDSACLPPYEPGDLDVCLEQHALCVECIESAEDLYACRAVFEACLAEH